MAKARKIPSMTMHPLVRIRSALGLTLRSVEMRSRKLAVRLQDDRYIVRRQTLLYIEQGANPKLLTLRALSMIYGVSMAKLVVNLTDWLEFYQDASPAKETKTPPPAPASWPEVHRT